MMNLRPKWNLQVIERRTALGMKQYLLLDGALWDVEDLVSQIRGEAALFLVEKQTKDLVETIEREWRQENASTVQDASPKFASFVAEC